MAQMQLWQNLKLCLTKASRLIPQEGSVVKGKVIAIEAGFAIVDVATKWRAG